MTPNGLKTNLAMWAPIIVFVSCVFFAITLHWEGEFKFTVNLGLVSIDRPLEKSVATRIVLVSFAIVAMINLALRDYGRFFPKDLRMTVRLDDQGVESALRQFSPHELEDLGIAKEWRVGKARYLAHWNQLLRQHGVTTFTVDQETTGQGKMTIRAQKTRAALQTYVIKEADGSVTMQSPLSPDVAELRVVFNLLPTPGNDIQVSPLSVFFPAGWTIAIKPQLTQIVAQGPVTDIRVANLVCLTKIRFFPWVGVGNTLYLYDTQEYLEAQPRDPGQRYVPVGYASYDFD